jgi:hypothetical protein
MPILLFEHAKVCALPAFASLPCVLFAHFMGHLAHCLALALELSAIQKYSFSS